MPELPEVETIRRSLEEDILQQIISDVHIGHNRLIRKQSSDLFLLRAVNSKVVKTERRGKFLIIHLEKNNEPYYFIIHLGMTGACFVVKNLNEVPLKYRNHVHIQIPFSNEHFLAYADIRKFGGLRIFNETEYYQKKFNASILNMGPEPFWGNAEELFLQNLAKNKYRGKSIKHVIMEQNVIAGIGNIYAAEILLKAKIRPDRLLSSISLEEQKEILQHTKEILEFSISVGGSSISDYMDAKGKKGRFQEYFQIYGLKTCQICSTSSEKIQIDDRSSYFCPSCQK